MQTTLRVNALWATAAVVLLSALTLPDAPVADAAMRNDAEAVRSLLRSGADVNTAQGDGMSALHWAAHHGNLDMARVLVHAGANLEATTRVGAFTPLLVASMAGEAEAVEALLRAGADPQAATTTGETALHFAARGGSVASVEALVAAGADVDARQAGLEQTPLMFAAHEDRADVVRALIRHGADLEARTAVVDYAAMAEQDEALEKQRMAVLEAMSREVAAPPAEEEAEEVPAEEPPEDEEAEEEDEDAEEAEDEDEQAEEEETEEDETEEEETEEEAEEGEEPEKVEREPLSYTDLVGRQGGLTALHLAARQGSASAAVALLEGGAEIDAVAGGDGSPPLLIAVVNGHFDLAKQLLDRGANPNLANIAGATPLYGVINLQWAPKSWYPQPTDHKAARIGYLELMEALLQAGADPNARLERDLWFLSYNGAGAGVSDTWGATPFWRAAWGTDVEAMKLLVAHGADPHIPTRRPPTRARYPRRGAEQEDKSGLPPVPVGGPGIHPIHAATGVGYGEGFAANTHRHVPDGWLEATRYLVEELGADVNARDYNGYTPLHHAASRGDVELIMYLVSKGADVTAVSRRGQTTADMANGPVQRVQPFPEALALLESLGAENNHNCVSC